MFATLKSQKYLLTLFLNVEENKKDRHKKNIQKPWENIFFLKYWESSGIQTHGFSESHNILMSIPLTITQLNVSNGISNYLKRPFCCR